MTKNAVVGQSSIDGKGIFATKDFKKGGTVFIFKGTTHKHINKSIKDTFEHPDWVGIDKNTWIDPKKEYHFINHSCDPNMGTKGKVTFCALKNIKKGSELTFDYSISEADEKWSMKCQCGSKNCRKVIKSIQFLPLSTYKHYLPYIPHFFQTLYNKSN